jgi:DNA polymerase I-like protein with 3'-5' exonuclease and polymerase domains
VNGLTYPFNDKAGYGLLKALRWSGLESISYEDKEEMRNLAMRGGSYSSEEQLDLLDYCESDVMALPLLLRKIEHGVEKHPGMDMEAALIRGSYVKTVAQMEFRGIPIDLEAWDEIKSNWPLVEASLVNEIDQNYGVYVDRKFKEDLFAKYLLAHEIPWELTPTGRLSLDKDFFKDMSETYPILKPLYDLRTALSQMRDNKLAVGCDGRNRALLGPFGATTGRNAYKAGHYIFGQAAWLRGLIRPKPGNGLAYIDWCHQEFGISAALSKDQVMMAAYMSGDPYIVFGKACGLIPPDGTKETYGDQRDLFKQCLLGIQYSMGSKRLALRLKRPEIYARWFLEQHRRSYKRFWEWSDGVVHYGSLFGKLWTSYGWERNIEADFKPASLRNFPVQGNAADMLRLACISCEEKGVRTIGTLHDAILIEFDIQDEHEVVSTAQKAMLEASCLVLDGFELRSEAKRVLYPERYMSERGADMWNRVWRIIAELKTRYIS